MNNSTFSKNKLIKIVCFLFITATFIKIYSSIFDKKVNLAGDNVSYYILGNSIANGDGYTNIQHLEKEAHYHYPPGYPLLIAGVTILFSNDIITIKILNGLLLFGSVLLLFFIIKSLTQSNIVALATSLITLLNYHILEFSTIMMSEIPFLFFSLLCLWIFIRLDFSKVVFKNWLFFLLIICLSFLLYIRSVALALFVSFAFFLFLKKHWTYLFNLISGLALLHIPWMIRNTNAHGNTYVNQLLLKNPYQPEQGRVGFLEIVERILLNTTRYITKEIPSGLMHVKDVIYNDTAPAKTEWLLGIFLIAIIVFGIYKLPKFRFLIVSYIFTFLSLLMLWPSVWYGTRFLIPLIPLLIFLFLFGILQLIMWLNTKVVSKYIQHLFTISTIIILSVFVFKYGKESIKKLKDKAEGVYTNNYQNYFVLAEWIQKNTQDFSVTSVRKEGVFYLLSKKPVTSYKRTIDREEQIAYLKDKNVDYVIVEQLGFSSTEKYLLPAINRYPNKFKIIKELKNPNTYLMQFLPELGYSGDWKNEKRNGLGTYLWEDGQKYIGHWKDDVRHGKGTVYFKNGESLTGVWAFGKLEGETIKRDKDLKILEKSYYKNNLKVINETK